MTQPPGSDQQRVRLLQQAEVYRTAGRAEDALGLAGPLLLDDPGDLDVAWVVALALHELSRHDEAQRVARQAVTGAPDEADAWRLLSITLDGTGEVDEAITAALRAVQLAPLDPAAHAAAGYALARSTRRRDRKQALQEAEEMLRLAPADPAFFVTYGHIQLRCDRISDAEGAYQQALGLDPGNVEARSGLARVHDQRGHMLRAYRAYAPVVAEQPDDRHTTHGLEGATGRWAGILAVSGVCNSWALAMFAVYADDPTAMSPEMFSIMAVGLVGLSLLVALSVGVRVLRDRRLGRILWSRHRAYTLAGVIGLLTTTIGAALTWLAPLMTVAAAVAVGAVVATVFVVVGRRARRAAGF